VDGEPVGYTYSPTGEYSSDRIDVVLLRDAEVVRGSLLYVRHPKNGSPVVYQVTEVYSRKRVRGYEEALLRDGGFLEDDEDTTVHASAYQWGWIDEDGRLRPLRHHLKPNTPVYKADREVVAKFTKPNSGWSIFLGYDLNSGLEVELDMYHLIRQCCLICGSVGSGKTTTAVAMVCRAAMLNPPVRFFIVDKDGEYTALSEKLGEEVVRVPWFRFFNPSQVSVEDLLAEFGWHRGWWTSKILLRAFEAVKASGRQPTKETLLSAVSLLSPEDVGFRKDEYEFEKYKSSVMRSLESSKLLPERSLECVDPVMLLRDFRVVIMDLSDGRDTWSQKHLVIAQALRRIMDEALENPAFGCVVVLEEAMYYAPQYGMFDVGTKESRSKLLSVIKEIATNGGRNGVGLWVVTQRLSTVDKTLITQCANNVICHSLEDLDKRRLSEVVGDEFTRLLGNLPQGEAIVKGTALKCRFPIWVRVIPEVYPSSSKSNPLARFEAMSKVEATCVCGNVDLPG